MKALSDRRVEANKRTEQSKNFARDLIKGLSQHLRSIPPKYFYDAAGSALFDRICRTPEYYPARAEKRILAEHASQIVSLIGSCVDVVEFGAGSLDKIRILLDAMGETLAPRRYVPIDISHEHLAQSAIELRSFYPDLEILPVMADYTDAFLLPNSQRRVGFFPGSSLGNFHPDGAMAFLQRASESLKGGGLLLGVDLVKDPARLHSAYNDVSGSTAAFNLNLLRRANHELGADFDLTAFQHHACYQPTLQRVEMHLVSTRAQVVTVDGNRFAFGEGDSIHTENSYKYSIEAIREMASNAGFKPGVCWTDPERLFSVHWLEAHA